MSQTTPNAEVSAAIKDLISHLDAEYDDLAALEINLNQRDKSLVVRILGRDRSLKTRRFEVIDE